MKTRSMRRKHLACAFVAVVSTTAAALAVSNNGFNTDHVYACRDPFQTGELAVFNELSGVKMTDLAPTGSNWDTLAFSGTGTSDARLFVAKQLTGDAEIAELSAGGAPVGSSRMLSSLTPLGSSSAFVLGNIRCTPAVPDSLFVAGTSNVSGVLRGMVWEINLARDTLKNVYTGPPHGLPLAGEDAEPRNTKIALGADGTIYMTAPHLNAPSANSEGDLVKMTGLNTFSVLVDGTTMRAGDSRWNGPYAVVYRKGDPGRDDGTDTALMIFRRINANAQPTLELYLNTTAHPADSNNNLIVRAQQLTLNFGWNGGQDTVSGGLWLAAIRGNVHLLRRDDTVFALPATVATARWSDAASPPYYGPVPPLIEPVANDVVPPGAPYSKQLTLAQGTSPVSFTKLAGPAALNVNSSGLVSGWTPTNSEGGNTFTVTIEAGNSQGADTVTWQVTVLRPPNNGFYPDYVYAAHEPAQGRVAVYRKQDLAFVQDLTPVTTTDGWHSITFSGRGQDIVRMYLMRPEGNNDVRVAEMNAQGQIVKSVLLSALLGQSPGPLISGGSVRFSPYHNHLFVSFDPDAAAAANLSVAYQLDLELTSIVATYHGDITNDDETNCEINPTNGRLYLISRSMGRNPDDGKGNLIEIDTSGGSTSAFTTIINGSTNPDSNWLFPRSVIYRDARNPSGEPTLLILREVQSGNTAIPILEYFANQSSGGNLVKRGEGIFSAARSWLGRQDRGAGSVWFGTIAARLIHLRTDNLVEPFGTATGASNATRWYDIDTPYVNPCHDPFADADGDGDVDLHDYAVFQQCYSGPGGPVSDATPYCACFDQVNAGAIDDLDFSAFAACSSRSDVAADECCDGGPGCP